jgi:hypothetical protein
MVKENSGDCETQGPFSERLSFDYTDYGLWRKFRDTVEHPATLIKEEELKTAQINLKKYLWARRYLDNIKSRVAFILNKPPEYFKNMIPRTTPGTIWFCMCPACEYAPWYGKYEWDPNNPDQIRCANCGTVYPNEKYPEDLVFKAKWGGGQTFTYYGGKYWTTRFWGNRPIRSSWTGNIRARKVAFMYGVLRDLAVTYTLTKEAVYAKKAKAILLRFAEVYPNYLVHCDYHEYADMDPKVAAANVNNLPEDEIDVTPAKPDRRLASGYWDSHRIGECGDLGFVKDCTLAYDLICDVKNENGKPLFSEGQKLKIERDLLLEGTLLSLYDPAIDNKSIQKRVAVALVGVCLGDPLRVRFGLEGFHRFIHEWFLPDGATSESPAYGLQTLEGLFELANVLQGYMDPPGFSYHSERLENLNIYGDSWYRAIFYAFYNSLLPNLKYPPLADSYPETSLPAQYVEFMYSQYRDPRFLALLRRLYGGNLQERGDEYALFHRRL